MNGIKKGFAQVLSAGQYASIQDKGRPGLENYGIPPSGYVIKNELTAHLCNAIEFFGTGLSLRFSDAATLHIYGVGISIQKKGEPLHDVIAISVQAGDIITIIKNEGKVGYLYTETGWMFDKIMGSYSQMKGITFYDRLYKGVVIPYQPDFSEILITGIQNLSFTPKETVLYASPGPEFIKYKSDLTEFTLTISPDTNRQAICFTEKLEGEFKEIKSSYTPVGTIQITKAGKIYILGRDGQTTGGYFRWGFINEKDLNTLYYLSTYARVIIKMLSYP